MTPRGRLTIVKLGGSLALAPYLRKWLTVLACCGGRAIIVPGGGLFADQVRKAQSEIGYDDRAAHHMALLAMEQFGVAICNLEPILAPAHSLRQIRQALRAERTPVWMATEMALEAAHEIPASWDVTSDSLAAWLAGRVGSRHVMLVKHGAPFADPPDIHELAAREVVDRSFPHYLSTAEAKAVFVGPEEYQRASALLGEETTVRLAGSGDK